MRAAAAATAAAANMVVEVCSASLLDRSFCLADFRFKLFRLRIVRLVSWFLALERSQTLDCHECLPVGHKKIGFILGVVKAVGIGDERIFFLFSYSLTKKKTLKKNVNQKEKLI